MASALEAHPSEIFKRNIKDNIEVFDVVTITPEPIKEKASTLVKELEINTERTEITTEASDQTTN